MDRSGGWENEEVRGPGGRLAKDAASWPGSWLGDGCRAALIWAGPVTRWGLVERLGGTETGGDGCGRLTGRGQERMVSALSDPGAAHTLALLTV